MAAIVKIEYKIGGEDAVVRSFKTILRASQQAANEQTKATKQATNDRVRAEKSAADSITKLALQESKNRSKAASEAARTERQATVNASREKIATLQATAAKEAAIIKASTALSIQSAKQRAAAEKDGIRAAAAEGRKAQTDADRQRRKADTEARRAAVVRRMEERRGERMSYAIDKARLDEINHRRGEIRSTVGNALKRGVGTGVGILGAGAALVGGYLGTSTVLDAGRAQLDLQRRQALLENQTGDKSNYAALSKSISNVVGEDAGSIMGGFEKVAGKSGAEGLKETKDYFLDLAKIAKGAGVSMEDLGDVTATLFNRGIKGKDLAENIRMLVQQGKDGAVEFKDMATMLDASSGALLNFKMGASQRAMTAGGLTQIGRTYGKSSAAEATNAVVDVSRDLGGKAALIKKLSGVDVHVAGTNGAQMKDINELLPAIIEGMAQKKTSAHLMGMGGIFTGNSTAIVNPLLQAATFGLKREVGGRYRIAGEGEKGDIKGAAAVKALLEQNAKASMDAGEAEKAFANVMNTQTEQVNVAMSKLKNELGEKLAPALTKVIPVATQMISAFGTVTTWALSNPFKAVGALMMASVAKSLVGAGFDKLVDMAMSRLVPNMNVAATTVNVVGGPGVGGPGVGGTAGSATSAAAGGSMLGPGLAAAAAIGVAGYGILSSSSDQAKAENDRQVSLGLRGFQTAGDLRRSGTKENRDAAIQALGDLEQAKSDSGVISRFGAGVAGGFKGLAKGDLSVGNIVTAIPQLALARGVGNAIYGAAGEPSKTTDTAIADLKDALSKSNGPAIAATEANTAAINALPGAIAAAVNLQGPKIPAP